jgi:hypothetical protein
MLNNLVAREGNLLFFIELKEYLYLEHNEGKLTKRIVRGAI